MFRTRRKANRFRNFGLLLVLASFASFYFGYETSIYVLYLVGLGLLSGSFPLFNRYNVWRAGAKGEETVAKHLRCLGKGFDVFHDVTLPRTKGDIDHIVVGPNGVFVVETKNNNGTIVCNGDSWSQLKTGKKGGHYKGKLGSPSKQAKRHATMLGNTIKRRLHARQYVNPVVVFANKKATLNIKNPTVAVLQPHELCDYITNHHSQTLTAKDQNQLANLIQPFSHYS